MTRSLPAYTLGALLLAACSTYTAQPPASSASAGVINAPGDASPQLAFKLASGTYRCEYGAQVEVRRDARDPNLIRVGWQGASYPMHRNASSSGLPRYEDAASGLVWIDLPWKSVLLDSRSGKPLVSECRGGGAVG
jgi:membrane-bound lysozyme inhibitor of c-type lysozyme MliC